MTCAFHRADGCMSLIQVCVAALVTNREDFAEMFHSFIPRIWKMRCLRLEFCQNKEFAPVLCWTWKLVCGQIMGKKIASPKVAAKKCREGPFGPPGRKSGSEPGWGQRTRPKKKSFELWVELAHMEGAAFFFWSKKLCGRCKVQNIILSRPQCPPPSDM